MAETPVVEKPKSGLWRVNYYSSNGAPATALVVAVEGSEAVAFLGIKDSSGVQAVRDRYPVEVVGVDKAHDAIPPIPVNVAPYQLPKGVSRDDLNAMQAQIDQMKKQLDEKEAQPASKPVVAAAKPPAPPAPKV